MSANTGGSAFPYVDDPLIHRGMTLRDYFAVHSVHPGMGEIATLAGLVFRDGAVWSDPQTRIARFDDWFNDKPLAERLDLFARVKYAMADAMLAARQEPTR